MVRRSIPRDGNSFAVRNLDATNCWEGLGQLLDRVIAFGCPVETGQSHSASPAECQPSLKPALRERSPRVTGDLSKRTVDASWLASTLPMTASASGELNKSTLT